MDSEINISKYKSTLNKLQKKLQMREMRINSVLEITNAINRNVSAKELFRIYEFMMRTEGVNKVMVFHKNYQWKCVCKYGVDDDVNQLNVEKHLLEFKTSTFIHGVRKLKMKVLEQFDLIIPVFHKHEPLAFILLGDMHLKTDMSKSSINDMIKFVQTITNIIVVAIENKRLFKKELEQESLKKELEVAERVQNMLIPSSLPNSASIEMSAVYMPHHNISGDYYDVIQLDQEGNDLLVCMADISGKGIAAALMMANFQAMLRALAMENNSLPQLVEKLNQRILEITNGDKFITFFIARHNLKEHKLRYINAGHNPPILSNNGSYKLLEHGCTILGAFDKLPSVQMTALDISPDTVIITYTDGLTDLENEVGEFFEMERLTTFVQANNTLPMDDFNMELLQKIKTFKGDQTYTDDITILSYRLH
ncbi:MAG: PP2C family protein-serine/threonine phosphatase [Chitinophagales bacterium]